MVCKCGKKTEEAGQANWNKTKLHGCPSCDLLFEEHEEEIRESLVKLSTWKKYKERA